jgi:hypothetical protein
LTVDELYATSGPRRKKETDIQASVSLFVLFTPSAIQINWQNQVVRLIAPV